MLKGKSRMAVNILLAAMIIALYTAVSTPVAKSAMSDLYNSTVYRGHKKGVVALSCAVSWDAAALPEFLGILRELDTRITFHVSGEWAERNANLLQEMVQDGHEIGTMGHTPLQDGDSAAVEADIRQSLKSIEQAGGIRPTLYYSGTREERTSARASGALSLVHVLCTVDLLSGRGDAPDILQRALEKPIDGSIVLMQPTGEACKALRAVLSGLAEAGYAVGTVSDALGENMEKDKLL